MLTSDEVIDHARLQRARPEQSHQCDDIFESIRLQSSHEIFHAARFELEDGGRLAIFEQLEGRRVVHRQIDDIERRLPALRTLCIDGAHGMIDDRQRAQTQKVELHEACSLDVILVELRDDRATAIFTIKAA